MYEYDIDYFIKEEKKGTIFCKIGKSSVHMWGKGGNFPYREYNGKIITLEEGSITFERLEDVVQFLHYGDDLIIFNFSKNKDMLPESGYVDNPLNKGCYNTKAIYVENVLSFKDAGTIDFIYSNVKDLSNFIEYCNIATRHLEDRELFDAAQRWRALAIKG